MWGKRGRKAGSHHAVQQVETSCNALVNSVFLGAGPGLFQSVSIILLLFLRLSFDPWGFIFGNNCFPEQCPHPHDEGLCSTSFGSLKHGTLHRPKAFPSWLMATHLMQRVGLKLWIYWAVEQYISSSRGCLSYTALPENGGSNCILSPVCKKSLSEAKKFTGRTSGVWCLDTLCFYC